MSILPWMLRLAALALGLATTPAWAQSTPTTLRFIPQADLRSIDPIWTTAYVTRNFGYLVFDTLFALAAADGRSLDRQRR
jgi:peptide/nickel transport system substrate-binding protein